MIPPEPAGLGDTAFRAEERVVLLGGLSDDDALALFEARTAPVPPAHRDAVRELARRNADNLHARLVEVNDVRGVCKTVPSAGQIAGFVSAAGELEPALTY